MIYLLDTNTCIYIIRRRPPRAFERLESIAQGDVRLSIITALELEIGALRAQAYQYGGLVRQFLTLFPILPLDDSMRSQYGIVRTTLERRGEVIGVHDMLIAAHALSLDAVLVTNNQREFKRVNGLRLENWVV